VVIQGKKAFNKLPSYEELRDKILEVLHAPKIKT
jgi:hypothetical protein